ncbi:MAG: hypothetical protein KME30_26090 [Iphinoe sp. HA4291-MV1]|jgi:hypothetical protein|nr:hypothetical protein [Iphinoe sp. HA4291-MV1]
MNNSNATTTKKVEKSKAKTTSLTIPALLFVLLGLGLVSVLPHLGQNTSKQATTPSGATVSIENGQKNDTIHVFWSLPVSQTQFWLDNSPVSAQCDQHNCTVPKHRRVSQIYFRWLDSSDNKWYYFQCNSDYRGQFKGIPL